MKNLKDKNGIIWGIILIGGVVLIAGAPNWGLWARCLGGFLIGLAYGSQWVRALRRN